MMDWQRSSLIAAIVLVFGYLFIQWNEFKEARAPVATDPAEESIFLPEDPGVLYSPTENSPTVNSGTDSDVPEVSPPRETAIPEADTTAGRLIQVQTDVLDLTIDTLGGDIVRAALRKHLSEQSETGRPFVILNRTRSNTYVAQSGLIGPNGTDSKGQRPVFRAGRTAYTLEEGQDRLVVTLELDQPGTKILKHYIFNPGEYLIGVQYEVQNRSDSPWQAYLFGQVKRDKSNPNTANAMGPRPYLGMAVTTDETNYKNWTSRIWTKELLRPTNSVVGWPWFSITLSVPGYLIKRITTTINCAGWAVRTCIPPGSPDHWLKWSREKQGYCRRIFM